jgi:hypothetical protein
MFVSTNERNVKSSLGGIAVRNGIIHDFSRAGIAPPRGAPHADFEAFAGDKAAMAC